MEAEKPGSLLGVVAVLVVAAAVVVATCVVGLVAAVTCVAVAAVTCAAAKAVLDSLRRRPQRDCVVAVVAAVAMYGCEDASGQQQQQQRWDYGVDLHRQVLHQPRSVAGAARLASLGHRLRHRDVPGGARVGRMVAEVCRSFHSFVRSLAWLDSSIRFSAQTNNFVSKPLTKRNRRMCYRIM